MPTTLVMKPHDECSALTKFHLYHNSYVCRSHRHEMQLQWLYTERNVLAGDLLATACLAISETAPRSDTTKTCAASIVGINVNKWKAMKAQLTELSGFKKLCHPRLGCSFHPFLISYCIRKRGALVHFRTLVTVRRVRVRVRVGLDLRLELVRVRIRARIRLGLDLWSGLG